MSAFAIALLLSPAIATMAGPGQNADVGGCKVPNESVIAIAGDVDTRGSFTWRQMVVEPDKAVIDLKAPGFERRGITLLVRQPQIFLICGKEVTVIYTFYSSVPKIKFAGY